MRCSISKGENKVPKMYFQSEGCEGVTSGVTGQRYNADRSGFINVTDNADVKAFQANGYSQAGGMPKWRKYWECECGWEASIRHCPRCDRDDLTKVEM